MIVLKRCTSKSGIALIVLTIWIVVDGLTAFAGAQVQPPRRQSKIVINPKKDSQAEKTEGKKVNVGKRLVGIARRASRQSENNMVDIVVVIERGEKMKASMVQIERHLGEVVGMFEESGVDFRLAPIWFQNH